MMPTSARALIAVTVAVATLAIAAQLPAVASWDLEQFVIWAGLVALTVVTEQFPISVRHGAETQVFGFSDAVWTAGLLLAQPSELVLAVAAGGLLARALRRTAPIKIAFNVGQYVVGVSLAIAVYGWLGTGEPTAVGDWLAVALGMSAYLAINSLSVAGIIALVGRQPLGDILLPTLRLSALHWAGNVAIGLVAALVWVTAPLGVPLVAAPLVLSYFAYRGWQHATQERDQLREMGRAADAISEQNDLSKRIPATGLDEEAIHLAGTLNAMLDRLEQSFLRERRFLSEVSHELRTPITICRGHLEVLSSTPTPDEVVETIGVVVDEMKRMSRIVDDMLTLASMEHPDTLRLESVDLGRLMRDVVAKTRPMLAHEPELFGQTRGVIEADRQRLTQAMLNLVQNARLHSSDEAPLRIGLLQEPAAWRIEVVDHGGGLPAGAEQDLFRPFHRGPSPRDGTGLGLAIVRAIAEAHGGAAGVDNRPGVGASFWIRLPR